MKAAEIFRQYESDAKMLEKISQNYPATSEEFRVVRCAAMALAYVVMHEREKFATFIEDIDQELSDEERAELRDRYDIRA